MRFMLLSINIEEMSFQMLGMLTRQNVPVFAAQRANSSMWLERRPWNFGYRWKSVFLGREERRWYQTAAVDGPEELKPKKEETMSGQQWTDINSVEAAGHWRDTHTVAWRVNLVAVLPSGHTRNSMNGRSLQPSILLSIVGPLCKSVVQIVIQVSKFEQTNGIWSWSDSDQEPPWQNMSTGLISTKSTMTAK